MTLRLWDATSGVCVQRFEDTSGPFISTAWSPDGTLLASGCGRRGVQVWDVRARSLLWVGQPPPTMFLHVSWSPDGTRLAGAGDDGSVYLWESVDGTSPKAQGWRGARPLPTKLSGHEGWVTSVEWSPDGEWLASGSASRGSGELFIWDAKTGERVQTFVGHTSEVYELAWSPRGDLLVTGGGDGKLRWWDVLTGECVSMREAHRGPIRSLKVSPDRRRLASCGNDGAIRIWDICSDSQRVQGKGTSPLPTPTAPPLLRTLRHDRPYERLNITGIRGLNEAQKASLLVLGAIDEAALRVEEGTMAGGVR
jgi:WD40 repeat protein